MITIAGTGDSHGDVSVIATESGGACGSAVLHITDEHGERLDHRQRPLQRRRVPPRRSPRGLRRRPRWRFWRRRPSRRAASVTTSGDGGGFHTSRRRQLLRDRRRHGVHELPRPDALSADAGGKNPFSDVSHTPEQTGGFSDTDLQNIILNGQIPDGGYFDPTVINSSCDGGAACTAQAYMEWSNVPPAGRTSRSDELPGIICYLRALARPSSQDGSRRTSAAAAVGTATAAAALHHDGGGGPPPIGQRLRRRTSDARAGHEGVRTRLSWQGWSTACDTTQRCPAPVAAVADASTDCRRRR
jgi:hypothetical protein